MPAKRLTAHTITGLCEQALAESGLSQSDVARNMGISRAAVSGIFKNLRPNMGVWTLDRALRGMGYKLELTAVRLKKDEKDEPVPADTEAA